MKENDMAISPVEESQRKAAKVAGFLYLFTMATANFAEFYVRGHVMVRDDALQTFRNIVASGQLFRIGIASDLITLAGNVILVVALYVIFKPIDGSVALLAAFWWLVECSIAAVTLVGNVAALLFLSSADPRALGIDQLQAVARLFLSMDAAGNRIGALFFGLGSSAFCYLWFKSRYTPRALAAFGILASLVPTIVPLATVVLPSLVNAPLRRPRSGVPIFIFEVLLGLWLLVKGLQTPKVKARSAP